MSQPLTYLYLKAQAVTLLLLGRKAAALDRFQAMLAIAPGNRYAMASCAHLLGELGHKTQAIAALEVLNKAYPDQSASWFNMGYLLDEV